LQHLWCDNNQLTSLDVSHNTSLQHLWCGNNPLTSLDVSHNTSLQQLWCDNNQLTSLDVSHNTSLQYLLCYSNQLTSLDVSHNTSLQYLWCYSNQLTNLDLRNGNNTNLHLITFSNPDLHCILVDDPNDSNTHDGWEVDPEINYTNNPSDSNCDYPTGCDATTNFWTDTPTSLDGNVTLRWENPNNGGYGWEIAYRRISASQFSFVTIPDSSVNIYTVSNLVSDAYYFFIRKLCDEGNNYSNWIGPVDVKVSNEIEPCSSCNSFRPQIGKKYILDAWVKEIHKVSRPTYSDSEVEVVYLDDNESEIGNTAFVPKGNIIDGWQRINGIFSIPQGTSYIGIKLVNHLSNDVYFDDIRIYPYNSNMKSYVYDNNKKLVAELDANNYATFYEYDNEGGLVRVKKETEKGIFTIQETRSSYKNVYNNGN